MFSIITSTPEQTQAIGEILGSLLSAGQVVCLYGDLGSGKTNLSYGIAMGLEVETRYVTSPTFTFVNEYEGRIPLYHIDLYRLTDSSQLEGIGFEQYLDSDGATVVEWADRAEEELPAERLNVYLTYLNETSREVGFFAEGAEYEKLLQELKRLIEGGRSAGRTAGT